MKTFNDPYSLFLFVAFMLGGEYKGGLIQAIKICFNIIKLETFKHLYIHSKWVRKQVMKKAKKSGLNPFIIFSFDQLARGIMPDVSNDTKRKEWVEQYIKEYSISEDDANEIRENVDRVAIEAEKKVKQAAEEIKNAKK